MADLSKWDWADTVGGIAIGMVSGIVTMVGWFGGKLSKVHERLNAVHARANEHAISIAVLETHHEAKIERLKHIESSVETINEKQDRQMEILMDIRGRG